MQSIFLSSENVRLLIDGPQQWLFCVLIKLGSYLLINIRALWEIISQFYGGKTKKSFIQAGFPVAAEEMLPDPSDKSLLCTGAALISFSALINSTVYHVFDLWRPLYVYICHAYLIWKSRSRSVCFALVIKKTLTLAPAAASVLNLNHCGAECINNSLISAATVSRKWMSKHVSILVPTPPLSGPVSGKERCSWTDCVTVERFSVYTTAAFITHNYSQCPHN